MTVYECNRPGCGLIDQYVNPFHAIKPHGLRALTPLKGYSESSQSRTKYGISNLDLSSSGKQHANTSQIIAQRPIGGVEVLTRHVEILGIEAF